MRKRKGQALIIVVIIIAIIMAGFANSLTTAMRYHAREETEIYQREQALYIAEMGINQMIFNMNNGTTYSDEDNQISGDVLDSEGNKIGSYTTIYHAPDNSGFGGSAYIESTGTVGKVERTVFVSIEDLSEAFKYCLFTSTGGRDRVEDDSYFDNQTYGDQDNPYKYNTDASLPPYPDPNYPAYAEKVKNKSGKNTYKITNGDLQENNNVIYIHKPNSGDTLTIDFGNISYSDYSFNLSIITDAENVTIKNLPFNFNVFAEKSTEWSGAKNSNDNKTYPVITHLGTGTLKIDYSRRSLWFPLIPLKLYVDGFVYTGGHIDMIYNTLWGENSGEFDGEVIEQDPQGLLGGEDGNETHLKYTTDYFHNPPPHFIIPTSVVPGSFREEY